VTFLRKNIAIAMALVVLCVHQLAVSATPKLVTGEVLVKFKDGTPASTKAAVHRQNNGRVLESIKSIGVERVAVARGMETVQAKKYKENKNVLYAEPNYIASIADTIPNDPLFLSNQSDFTRIGVQGAWDISTGSSSVIVAVIDTGVDYAHPDLGTRVVQGRDFYNGDSDPADDNGHGTAVAGIIGACTNNMLGIAGLTWNTKIMPIKVTSSTGSAPYSAIANGIIYAADNGARVASISIAGGMYSSTLENAVNYAYQRGCLVVAAAGNSSSSSVYYPAGCTNAVAVGATDGNDQLYSYSNYGSALDIVAPGYAYTTARGGGYCSFGGTSCATPHVSGVAALIASLNLQYSAADIANILTRNADDLGYGGWDQYTGWGRVNAYKALHYAYNTNSAPLPAVDTQPPSIAIISPTNGAEVSGIVTLSASASDNVGVESLQFLVDGVAVSMTKNANPTSWDSRTVANGSHVITAIAVDAAGNSSASAPVTVNVNNTTEYTQAFGGTVVANKGVKSHVWTATQSLAVTTKLSWSGSAVLELRLYNSSGALLASQSSGSSPLILDAGILPAGNYTFAVKAISGKARYQLTVSAQSP